MGVKLCMRVRLLSVRSSPILVNFGSRWVRAAALLPGWRIHIEPKKNAYIQITPGKNFEARLAGQSELAVARWGSRNWGRRHRVRPYGGICVLQACWRTCWFLTFSVTFCQKLSTCDIFEAQCKLICRFLHRAPKTSHLWLAIILTYMIWLLQFLAGVLLRE